MHKDFWILASEIEVFSGNWDECHSCHKRHYISFFPVGIHIVCKCLTELVVEQSGPSKWLKFVRRIPQLALEK